MSMSCAYELFNSIALVYFAGMICGNVFFRVDLAFAT